MMMAMTSVLSLGKSTGTKGALCAYGSFIRVILAPVVRSTGIAKRGGGGIPKPAVTLGGPNPCQLVQACRAS